MWDGKLFQNYVFWFWMISSLQMAEAGRNGAPNQNFMIGKTIWSFGRKWIIVFGRSGYRLRSPAPGFTLWIIMLFRTLIKESIRPIMVIKVILYVIYITIFALWVKNEICKWQSCSTVPIIHAHLCTISLIKQIQDDILTSSSRHCTYDKESVE